MRMTVLNVAYPFAAVGPDSIGGAEQILSLLDQQLVRAGHRSIVVACEGSITAGTLIASPVVDGVLTDDLRHRIQRQHRRNIDWAIEKYSPDVIHMHGIDFYDYLPPDGPPVLVTLHLPPAWYPRGIFQITRPRTYLHCVSASQRRACPANPLLLPDIPNGVPIDELTYRCTKHRYAITLGRICPEKNFHVALDAGKHAGIPVLLGGQVFPYPAHLDYFNQQILPRLDDHRRFIGPIGFARKRRLLSGARCFLHPTLAPETSSLVAMESLACGTPVIAFRSGALPEIIEHGVTGFLVNNEREMADAINAAGDLEPEACRQAARQRFSLDAMIQKYFQAYDRLITIPPAAPLEWGHHAALL